MQRKREKRAGTGEWGGADSGTHCAEREREGRVGVHEWGGTYRRDPLRRERGESRHAQGGPVRPKGRGGWVSELLSFFFFYF